MTAESKGLILVVEDEAAICMYMEEIFRGEGYEVLSAENGKAALDILRGLESLPCIIFLDVMMPVMDGYRFIDQVQNNPENKKFKDIPLVVVTAVYAPIPGKLFDIVRKPPNIDRLIELADKCSKRP